MKLNPVLLSYHLCPFPIVVVVLSLFIFPFSLFFSLSLYPFHTIHTIHDTRYMRIIIMEIIPIIFCSTSATLRVELKFRVELNWTGLKLTLPTANCQLWNRIKYIEWKEKRREENTWATWATSQKPKSKRERERKCKR